MDNFMDKLAEKYNAQDMIRANSQAETAQMQSLQDQVEAYEAVLQEMRKLNYKNTELTEKMYALVDESLEKVRTLQIEASEGSVSTAEVTREMQDAVNQAVNEAISSMDETMARTLAASLQQPTDEMRQSNERMAEDVRNTLENTLQTMQNSTESLRQATESVTAQVQSIDEQLAGVKEEVTGTHADIREISAATDLLMETLEKMEANAQKASEDARSDEAMEAVSENLRNISAQIAALKDNGVTEKLQAVSAEIAALKESSLRTEAPQEVLDGLRSLSEQIAALKEKEEEAIRFNADAFKEPEISNAELLEAIRAIESANKGTKDDLLDELKVSDNAIQDRLFAIQQSNTTTEESIGTVAAAIAALQESSRQAEAPQEVLDAIRELSDQVLEIKIAQEEQQANDKLQAVAAEIAALKEANLRTEAPQEVLDGLRSLSEQIDALKEKEEEAIRFNADAFKAPEISNAELLDELKVSDNAIQDRLFAIQQSNTTTEETIGTIAAAVAALQEGSRHTEAPQEVLDAIRDLSDQVAEVRNAQEVLEKLQEVSGQIAALKAEDKSGDVAEKLQEVSGQIAALKAEDKSGDVAEKLQEVSGQVAALKAEDKSSEVSEKLQAIAAEVAAVKAAQQRTDVMDKLQELSGQVSLLQEVSGQITELKAEDKSSDIIEKLQAIAAEIATLKAEEQNSAVTEKLQAIAADIATLKDAEQQDAKNTKEALFYLRTSSDELKGIGNDTKAGLQDIYDSLEKAKKGIADIKAQQLQPQEREGDAEVRQALTELLSGHSELVTNLRNVKSASDESKNTLKAALDTAVYGIKQDNKELVGILQRMNATLTSRDNDEDKTRKEEEERARIEEDRRLLEERFKLTEDFMHKESVKVYRNVQAVINEKNDKQREGLDNGNQSVMSSVSKVKAWAIISTIIGGANLVLLILHIFEFFSQH